MRYSIATSGESLPMPNQTNKRHVCALPELCVKPCGKVSLLDHLVSQYCPCYDQAVSDLNNIRGRRRYPLIFLKLICLLYEFPFKFDASTSLWRR